MALTEAQQLDAYLRATGRVRSRLGRFAETLWGSMSGYRDADIDRMVELIVPRVQAGQLQVASLTAAYVARVAGEAGVILPAAVTGGRGVPAAEVYRRPAATVYTQLAKGEPYSKATAAGGTRLSQLVSMDVQMAKVRQFRTSAQASGVQAFRRVLSGGENCAMCAIASTQRYYVENLMPIHPGCDCGVSSLSGGADVPQTIDPALLDETHGHVAEFAGISDAGGRAPDYRKLLVTEEHGEHGPSLRWAGEAFTGPGDI